MPAGGGDLERPLGDLLTAHVGEVGQGSGWLAGAPVGDRGGGRSAAGGVREAGGEIRRGERGTPPGRRGRPGASRRQEELPGREAAGQIGDREATPHRADGAVEAELAADEAPGERLLRELPVGGEQRQRDREVEVVPLLAEVGGREVHGDRPGGQVEAAVLQRGANPLPALADGGVGQADDLDLGQAVLDVDLDIHRPGLDPPGGGGNRTGEHHPRETPAGVSSLHPERNQRRRR